MPSPAPQHHDPLPRRRFALGMTAAALGGLAAGAASACAPVPFRGQRIDIVDETAVIVWEEASRTQHFIRRAVFDTRAPRFGFIVPTPTRPELAAMPDTVIEAIESALRPPVVEVGPSWMFDSLLLSRYRLGAPGDTARETAGAPRSAVRVLGTQRVAGLDATILSASDAKALAAWLAGNGFDDDPAISDWLAPYVAAGWIITAFRFEPGESAGQGERGVQSELVRMSFRTEAPFFPYVEPDRPGAAPPGRRRFRVALIAERRLDLRYALPGRVVAAARPDAPLLRPAAAGGTRPERLTAAKRDELLAQARAGGNTAALEGALRPFEVAFAAPLEGIEIERIATALGALGARLGASPWLTVFDEYGDSRPALDLVFVGDASAEVKRPPPIPVMRNAVLIPVELPLLAAGLGGGIAWWRRRRRR